MLNESNLPYFRSSMCEKFWCYVKQNPPNPYNRWKTTKEISFIKRHLDIPGDLKEYCLILFDFLKLITELQNSYDFSTGLIWKNMSEFSSKIVEFIARLLQQSTTSQWNLSAIKESYKDSWIEIQYNCFVQLTPLFSHNIFLLILLFHFYFFFLLFIRNY